MDIFSTHLDDIIIETITSTLNDIFGKKVTRSINKAMNLYSYNWEEIPGNSLLFSTILCSIIGKGHVIVEDLILETLYREIGCKYEYVEDYNFQNHIEKIRNTP